MNSEKKPTLEEIYPLPEGMKLRRRKFGVNPATSLKAVPAGRQHAAVGHEEPPFKLRWEDSTLGLTVVLNEDLATGKLRAEVCCTDPALQGKACASVALIGKEESQMIRKTIKLDQPDSRTGGCCGSEDFGLLKDAVERLGAELGLVVFMLV